MGPTSFICVWEAMLLPSYQEDGYLKKIESKKNNFSKTSFKSLLLKVFFISRYCIYLLHQYNIFHIKGKYVSEKKVFLVLVNLSDSHILSYSVYCCEIFHESYCEVRE